MAELPPHHHRSLSVTAQMVERTAAEIEAVLRREPNPAAINHVAYVYSPEERSRILSLLRRLRGDNERLFRELHLDGQSQGEDQHVRAATAYLWTVLVDSKADKLKRFGELPRALEKQVDEHVSRLLDTVNELMNASPQQGTNVPGDTS